MESIEQISELNAFYCEDSQRAKSCGYCKEDGIKSKTSYSCGFSTEILTPEMYEKIMFLGWRRCGEYVYKPNLEKSCCKLYTLRLDIDRFKINKNQRRVMKNFRKYLAGEEIKKGQITDNYDMAVEEEVISDKFQLMINEILKKFINSEFLKNNFNIILDNSNIDFKVLLNKNSKLGDYSSNLFIILFHYWNKTNPEFKTKFGNPTEFYNLTYNYLLNYLKSKNELFYNTWKIDMAAKTGHINFYAKDEIREEVLKMRNEIEEKNEMKRIKEVEKKKKMQTQNINEIQPDILYKLEYFDEIVHEPKYEKAKMKHIYTIELEPNNKFTKEKFEVYKKYQIEVHKDKDEELTEERYINSWGSTNLKYGKTFNSEIKNKLYPTQLGTYDLVHRIDGRIIAVGILDILPHSISSVYLYYDPEFSFLNLGVFSAIREIEYLRELNKNLSKDLKYYCMGFYCHTCPKMKYKGQYFPSQILCPVTLNFVDLEIVAKELIKNEFIQLTKEEKNEEVDLSQQDKKMILKSLEIEYQNLKFNFEEFVRNYINPKMRVSILKNLEDMIINLGKNNIKQFKIIGS